MMYVTTEFIRELNTGATVDELGNPVSNEASEVVVNHCRLAEWTSDDIAVYGREVTANNQKMLVKPFSNMLSGLKAVKFAGQRFEIVASRELGRWTLLILKGYHNAEGLA